MRQCHPAFFVAVLATVACSDGGSSRRGELICVSGHAIPSAVVVEKLFDDIEAFARFESEPELASDAIEHLKTMGLVPARNRKRGPSFERLKQEGGQPCDRPPPARPSPSALGERFGQLLVSLEAAGFEPAEFELQADLRYRVNGSVGVCGQEELEALLTHELEFRAAVRNVFADSRFASSLPAGYRLSVHPPRGGRCQG